MATAQPPSPETSSWRPSRRIRWLLGIITGVLLVAYLISSARSWAPASWLAWPPAQLFSSAPPSVSTMRYSYHATSWSETLHPGGTIAIHWSPTPERRATAADRRITLRLQAFLFGPFASLADAYAFLEAGPCPGHPVRQQSALVTLPVTESEAVTTVLPLPSDLAVGWYVEEHASSMSSGEVSCSGIPMQVS